MADASFDPTARTSGWWDSLFGEPTRHARQPQSRGALLGMGGFQRMPDPKSTITDQRYVDPYANKMADQAGSVNWEDGWKTRPYDPSPMSGSAPVAAAMGGQDSFPSAQWTAAGGVTPDTGAYDKPSFPQNMKPGRAAPPVLPSTMGPQLPQNMGRVGMPADPFSSPYTDAANYLPPIGAHLPIAPGDPGWTSPPSLSGPHNRMGDPNRPGYGSALGPMGMTLNSVPQGWQ